MSFEAANLITAKPWTIPLSAELHWHFDSNPWKYDSKMPSLPLKTQHKYAAMKDEKCIQAVCVFAYECQIQFGQLPGKPQANSQAQGPLNEFQLIARWGVAK